MCDLFADTLLPWYHSDKTLAHSSLASLWWILLDKTTEKNDELKHMHI